MSTYDIIKELQAENGSNYKMDILRKYSDNSLLKRVLKMTYDKVAFTYGVSMKNVDVPDMRLDDATMTLDEALDILERDFLTRITTGNNALAALNDILWQLNEEDRYVFTKLINRDMRINMGRSNINKVYKGLIVKPVYMRCGLFTKKTAKKINPEGAFVQLKADGTYREFMVVDGKVDAISRSGEEYEHPEQEAILENYPDGHYIGELTVHNDSGVLDRATGNGMIKADKFPENHYVVFDVWDFVTLEEYTDAGNKIKGTTPYKHRFLKLVQIVESSQERSNIKQVRVIETHIVNTVKEALAHCIRWMNDGLEGAIYKDKDAIFRDGTSLQQLKLKIEFSLDVRIIGFIEGKKGTKREKTFGSIIYETDDTMIRGSVSGFTDKQLNEINQDRVKFIGQVIEIIGNDLTRSRDNNHFAVSHPRFSYIRDDKDETDDLFRAQESLSMAKTLGTF